jgi:precorrin-4 C11-methyltransferase
MSVHDSNVHFVGAGPGAPDLITLRGKELLSRADVIIYAGSLVNPALLEYAKSGAEIHNSALMTLDEVIEVMAKASAGNKETVRLHTGDPSLYGAIREQIDRLNALDIPWDICPGVSSFCAAAAALGTEYTLPGVSQTVIITRAEGRSSVPNKEKLSGLAAHGATMVLFLSAAMLDKVSKELISGGVPPETPAAIVYKASWPEERVLRGTVGTLASLGDMEKIEKTALVVVGNVLGNDYELSRLYSPDFSTGFREAAREAGMKTALIAVSEKGASLAQTLSSQLHDADSFVYSPYAAEGQTPFEDVRTITQKLWAQYEGLVFICAAGIAVRAIAPLVSSKHDDPAVVVTADNGAYVVSLLSGHEGGANGLAMEVAACINGTPVISTASEASPHPLPRNLIVGVGCRRGTSAATLQAALEKVFAAYKLSFFRLRSVASIAIKKDERGLLELAEILGVPLLLFSAEELNAIAGEFSSSSFVNEVTGTDNVCERAAMLAAGGKGHVIVPKQKMEGITIAVCEKDKQ